VSRRHWRSYATEPPPSPQEALGEPFGAFPSWFLRIECERCHKVQWLNQAHMPQSEVPLRTMLARMRHEHRGGRPAKVELLTGGDAASARPVRRIVLRAGMPTARSSGHP
jgi:hypothetical protein